jgi:hypothetical protein
MVYSQKGRKPVRYLARMDKGRSSHRNGSKKAAKRIFNDRKAPGSNGILEGVVKKSIDSVGNIWVRCFSKCLENGVFPVKWKIAKLVLLKKKEGMIADHSIYRPICLLNESAKLLKRIIAGRVDKYLREIIFIEINLVF